MGYIPDNYDLWVAHDWEQEKALEKLPKCDWCGEPIQSEYLYKLGNELVCEDCMEECRESVDCYMDNHMDDYFEEGDW